MPVKTLVNSNLPDKNSRFLMENDGKTGGGDRVIRETFVVSRSSANARVSEWMKQFPSATYWSRIESWEELTDGSIRITMTRLPSAD